MSSVETECSAMQSGTVTVARAEFTRPVEHIMRCDDFKSNFARKLSTRYTSTHSPTPAPRIGNKTDVHDNVSAKIELRTDSPLSESVSKQEEPDGGDCAAVGVDVDTGADMGASGIRLATLNMEVDTLRWQLAQTEANRQMHIALLRQVVSFLSRVKEHIECQKEMVAQAPAGELSRARSVLHLPASAPAPLTHPLARAATRSISSADAGTWNNSLLILPPENQSNQKMSEEISRLVCLANTVLSTKLPELSCCCADKEEERARAARRGAARTVRARHNNFHADDITPMSLLKNSCAAETIGSTELTEATTTTKTLNMIEKRNDYEQYSFIEDESGFSSMSSFQEIGIPIISIIPASPCEEVCATAVTSQPAPATTSADEGDTTATSSTAAAVHVFWV